MSASTVPPPALARDHAAESVAALVARGMDQWEASLLVYTPLPATPEPPVWDAPAAAWSDWVRRHVFVMFAPLRKAVGLR